MTGLTFKAAWAHVGVLVCWVRNRHAFGAWKDFRREVDGCERICLSCGLTERHEYR